MDTGAERAPGPGGVRSGGPGAGDAQGTWRVDTLSWLDQGGDVSWGFAQTTSGGERWVRSGVRLAARPLIMRASGDPLGGSWTAPLLAHAAAAASLAPPATDQVWVSASNFAAVHEVVRQQRRRGVPLFQAGALEDELQFHDPHAARPQD